MESTKDLFRRICDNAISGSDFQEPSKEGLTREIVKRFRALLKLNGITPPPGEPTFQIKRNAAGKIRLEVTFG